MNNEPNISVFGDGAGEDFPVLKAFQQYIDAEQAKARRRLLTVSAMFVVIILAVIAIFSALVIKANDQTQALNDRLVEFAMKESDRKVESAKAAVVQETTVKALNETLEKLQKQIEEQERKASEAASNAANELAEAKKAVGTPAPAPAPVSREQQEAEQRLQKALAALKVEKQKLAEEKEKLRQEQLEKYRREHYPQYYAKKEAAESADTDDTDDLDDLLNLIDELNAKPAATPKAKKPATKKPAPNVEKIDLNDDDAIDYFSGADSYTIPVEVKGKGSSWSVPLD